MPKQVRRAAANHMFSKDDIIFSYTTKHAVADGVLVKADSEQSSQVKIKVPVYFTRPVWDRYVEVPKEFEGEQDLNGRLADLLLMFAAHARNTKDSMMKFSFTCKVPYKKDFSGNEKKSNIGFQYRDVTLKSIINAQDIDDPSPAIFIMLPWED